MSENEVIKLLEDYQPLIRKVSLMHAKNSAEADDMFQEICIQVWKAYPRFKGDSKFSTWLYRVAINTAISWIRKEKKHKFVAVDNNELWFGISDDKPFYEEEEHKERLSTMHRAINKLNDLDKTLVLLYLEDVAYADISEIIGLTVNNIKVKMNRLKKRLKKLMEDDG